jgi:hypothetical protein
MRPAVSPLSRWSGSCWLTEPSGTDRERILVAVRRLPEAGDVWRLKGIEVTVSAWGMAHPFLARSTLSP